jgi:hypothetical protein
MHDALVKPLSTIKP